MQNVVRWGTHPKDPPTPEVADEAAPTPGEIEILGEPHQLPALLGLPGWAAGAVAVGWLALTFFILGWVSISNGFTLLLAGPAIAGGIWALIARSQVAPVLILTRNDGTAVFRWEWWLVRDALKLPAECRWKWRRGTLHVIDGIDEPVIFNPTPARAPEATSEDFGVAVEQTAIGGLVKAQTRRQEVMETIQAGVMFGMVGLLALANFLLVSRILDGPRAAP